MLYWLNSVLFNSIITRQVDEKTLQNVDFVRFGFWQSFFDLSFLRRGRDSNPRYPLGVHTLSKRTSSTTRAPLRLQCNRRGARVAEEVRLESV